ncbi:MAG: ribonuclease G [Lactobacillales bacterium]|nr:ribonuclease G [Lactobacillales bacterium]
MENKERVMLPKWNWGAFGLTWIWGLGNGVFIMLLSFIPAANIIMAFIGALKGYEWLWETGKYQTVEEMKADQKAWNTIGIIFFVLNVVGVLFLILFFSVFVNYLVNLAPTSVDYGTY